MKTELFEPVLTPSGGKHCTHCGQHICFKCNVIDLFRGACAVTGNVQVAGHVKPAPFSRRDVTLGDVDGSLFHIKI